jgi:hypothetical protein
MEIKQTVVVRSKLLFTNSIALLIILGTILPLFISLGTVFNKLNILLFRETYLLLYIIVGLYGIYKLTRLFYSVRISNRNLYITIGILSVIFVFLKYQYVVSFDQELLSDFKSMWNFALRTNYLGEFIPPDKPQFQRPLVSLVPLVYLFGNSTMVFKIANLVFIFSSALIIVYLVSKMISNHAAILSFIIIMLVPELYFASIIPTHDIPGTFYLILYLFIAYKIDVKKSFRSKKNILYVVCLIFFGLLLEIQRHLFFVLLVSLAIAFVLSFILSNSNLKGLLYKLLLIIIIPFIGEQAIFSLLEDNEVLVTNEKMVKAIKYGRPLIHTHTFSDGSYGLGDRFYQNYVEVLDSDKDLQFFKTSLVLSDLYYNIKERPMNYVRRSKFLYSLGSQSGFYYTKLKNVETTEQEEITKSLNKLNTVFTSFFLITLLSTSTFFMFYRKVAPQWPIYAALIFMSIISMALLLVGESQPRYLFMGWFLWPIIIVWGIDRMLGKSIILPTKGVGTLLWSEKGVLGVIVLLIILYYFFVLGFKNSKYRMIDMSIWDEIECSQNISPQKCNMAIIDFDNNMEDKKYSTLMLKLPQHPKKNDFVRVSKVLEAESEGNYVLSAYVMSPYFRKDGGRGYFNVNIYINDELKKTLYIADSKKYRFLKFNSIEPVNSKVKVSLEIFSHVSQNLDSWEWASLVNFKFMNFHKE